MNKAFIFFIYGIFYFSRIVITIINTNKGIITALNSINNSYDYPREVKYTINEEYKSFIQAAKFINRSESEICILEYEYGKNIGNTDIYILPLLHKLDIPLIVTFNNVSPTPSKNEELIMNGICEKAHKIVVVNNNDLKTLKKVYNLPKHKITIVDNEVSDDKFDANHVYSKTNTWSKIAKIYQLLSEEILFNMHDVKDDETSSKNLSSIPDFSLEYIKALTDETGIMQQDNISLVNKPNCYCLDDNSRALLMSLMLFKKTKDHQALKLASKYISFIKDMQNKDGSFKQYLCFNGSFSDEKASEDAFGRTMWALGYLLENSPSKAFYNIGKNLFFNALPNCNKLKTARGIANAILGISYYLKSNVSDKPIIEKLRILTFKLVALYERNSKKYWKWFEPTMTYNNAKLPLALLHSAELLNNDKVKTIALESMNFLTKLTLKEGYLSVIGSEKWYNQFGEQSKFCQQPLNVMSMVLMFQKAYNITNNPEYLEKLYTSFMWFHGDNILRTSLLDSDTKGCSDGIESYGINHKQGAESTIAYLISHLAVSNEFKIGLPVNNKTKETESVYN